MKSPNTRSYRTLLSLALSVACWRAAAALDSYRKQPPVAPKRMALPGSLRAQSRSGAGVDTLHRQDRGWEALLMPDGMEIVQFGRNVRSFVIQTAIFRVQCS